MILHQVVLTASLFALSSAFLTSPPTCRNSPGAPNCLKMGSAETIDAEKLYDATKRQQTYQQNTAQYLVDLSDSRATFDFCGGMMFEFKLTDKLRARLLGVSGEGSASLQPSVADSSKVSRAIPLTPKGQKLLTAYAAASLLSVLGRSAGCTK